MYSINTLVFRMACLTSFMSDVQRSVSYLLDNQLLVFCSGWGGLVARLCEMELEISGVSQFLK